MVELSSVKPPQTVLVNIFPSKDFVFFFFSQMKVWLVCIKEGFFL